MGSYNFVSDIHDNCVIFSKTSKNKAWNIKEVFTGILQDFLVN